MSRGPMRQLFTNQATNANSSAVDLEGPSRISILSDGDDAGGTLTLELSPDEGTTWISSGQTLTAAGEILVESDADQYRIAMSGMGTGGTLNAWGRESRL